MKAKANRRKETTRIRAEINGRENRHAIEDINKSKTWFFDKVNITDKNRENSNY